MVTMRAKMKVNSVSQTEQCCVLEMHAVYKDGPYPEDGTDEDNTFAKWTPQADLKMTINNPDLLGKFQPGQTFYLDFTEVET